MGLYTMTEVNCRDWSVVASTKKRHTIAKGSRPPQVSNVLRPVFHAVEGAFRPHEFRGKNQQTQADDDEAWSRQHEHCHADRHDRETNDCRDDELQMPNHLYFDSSRGDNRLKEKPVHLLRHLVAASILLVVTAAPALADGLIVPFLGFNFGGDSDSQCTTLTNCKEKRMNFGVS